MEKLAKATAVLKDYQIPNDIKLWDKPLKNKNLQDSFIYCIKTEESRIGKKEKLTSRMSKMRGTPQLPKDFEWPEDYYFLCQMYLPDLRNADLYDLFPKVGLLYIFLDPSCFDGENFSKIGAKVYYSKTIEGLELREFPNKDSFNDFNKYYYNEFIESNKIDNFFSCFGFDFERGLSKTLPKMLILEEISGAKYSDDNELIGSIYGEGDFCQGEDLLSFFAPDNWDFTKGMYECGDKVLLYQTYLGDGRIHFWIERKNLKMANFSEVFVTYSGT